MCQPYRRDSCCSGSSIQMVFWRNRSSENYERIVDSSERRIIAKSLSVD